MMASKSWQMALTDFSLILSLTLLAGATFTHTVEFSNDEASEAPAQAFFDSAHTTQSLNAWLEEQGGDPRLSLDIEQSYAPGEANEAADLVANAMLNLPAEGRAISIKMIPDKDTRTRASLSYDCSERKLAHCLHN
ncbi:hypothetical protein [Sphingomicrobium astaxanthinifaciens]|uniref:hypothetical protein n=1 Tax=Sphingomicrobium astaxanthinifaciens TaxID=1227949 RepID=UPI001FCA7563|nr:hypothetical protein [Sphingomicrobium astaxanthinifaciens]MCJ7420385.1 hypothetical protein [Sphingomicrobium astaxanthinifaciens]